MHFVYLLKCNDYSIYTGCTSNLETRIIRHNRGEVHYTKDRLPLDLITFIAFKEKHKAYFFERYLKSGSGKAFAHKRLI